MERDRLIMLHILQSVIRAYGDNRDSFFQIPS